MFARSCKHLIQPQSVNYWGVAIQAWRICHCTQVSTHLTARNCEIRIGEKLFDNICLTVSLPQNSHYQYGKTTTKRQKIASDNCHFCHHHKHAPDWNVAVSTSCLQRVLGLHAELSSWLSGQRSASRVQSQVWRGRPGRRLHSLPNPKTRHSGN